MLPSKKRVMLIVLFTAIVYVVVLFVVVALLLYSITGFRSLGPDN